MDETLSADRALIAAFWSVLAERGWAGTTLGRVAGAAGVPVGELRDRFPDRLAILRLHLDLVDRAMRETVSAGAEDSVHDRLHDVLMCRIEALQVHRAGILAFASDLRRDPWLGLAMMPDLLRSMRVVLEAAGLEAGGTLAPLRLKGMLAVWLAVLRAWRQDEGADLGHTMAEADKVIARAGDLARRLGLAARTM